MTASSSPTPRRGPDFNVTRAQLFLALAKNVPQNGQLVPNPYRSWNEIDPSLPAERIEVLGPPPTSGTRDAFVELVMDKGCETVPEIAALQGDAKRAACQQVREDGAYIDAGENDNLIVQKLQANPAAFGIFGYSFLEQNADTLKAAQVEGVAPTYEAISGKQYPVARELYVYVKDAHRTIVPGINSFVRELVSERAMGADGYLADKGLVPFTPDERKQIETQTLAALGPRRRGRGRRCDRRPGGLVRPHPVHRHDGRRGPDRGAGPQPDRLFHGPQPVGGGRRRQSAPASLPAQLSRLLRRAVVRPAVAAGGADLAGGAARDRDRGGDLGAAAGAGGEPR